MDRILFGDNQFFGINHASEEKSRNTSLRFKRDINIVRTLHDAFDEGISSFMCTTHDRMIKINELIRGDDKLSKNLKIYPCLPYAHKYANAITDQGITGALKNYLPGNYVGSIFKVGIAIASYNILPIMELLIDAEMKMFRDIKVPGIFLQNVITDLLLGLGMHEVILAYHKYIIRKYNVEPGYITMNMPMLYDVFHKIGVKDPLICTSINVDGFRMTGGRDAYEKLLCENRYRVIAMQIFSGGSSSPLKSVEYVCSLKGVNSILFGASTKCNIHDTVSLIHQSDIKNLS